MAVYETGKRLRIKDGPITLTAFVDADGKIAISHTLFGLRVSPADWRKVLDELAPEDVPGLSEDALFTALHEYRRCSEHQARGIITAYLAAQKGASCD